MSKSFGKYVTMGICYGSNTEYYRGRRKHQRHVNKQRIRNIIANNNIEEFDEKYNPYNIEENILNILSNINELINNNVATIFTDKIINFFPKNIPSKSLIE